MIYCNKSNHKCFCKQREGLNSLIPDRIDNFTKNMVLKAIDKSWYIQAIYELWGSQLNANSGQLLA